MLAIEDHNEQWQRIDSVESIKTIIDQATDCQDMYEKSLYILQKMEEEFKDTLDSLASNENWEESKRNAIIYSLFDSDLNTEDPRTLFEKKGAELLERSKAIVQRNQLLNTEVQLAKVSWEDFGQENKDNMVQELFQTRLNAIKDFKDDVADGVLSNENNINVRESSYAWQELWLELFWLKEDNKQEFEKHINNMSLSQLIYWTFNIYEGSWAFNYCFWKIKEKLWNQSLFDFIDAQKGEWDLTSEILKYSALKMLFLRKKTDDLCKWFNEYRWNKEELMNYVKQELEVNYDFKLAFLTSIRELEKTPEFSAISVELKDKDPNVKKAYEKTLNFDNVDVFTSWKIKALAIYDDEWHWWWWAFFQAEIAWYKNQWFSVRGPENNPNYTKYVLKNEKWDTITMIQLKIEQNRMYRDEVKNAMSSVVEWTDFNFFALRWHCYNTDKMAFALWDLNTVQENDVLIDGWCRNATKTDRYYAAWVKWHIFAYTSEWRWASTQSFINKMITAKSSWKKFSDILDYYNNKKNEAGADGYFAFNVERPDSVSYQYKKLTQWNDWTDFNWLTQDLPISSNEGELEAHTDRYEDPETHPQEDDI